MRRSPRKKNSESDHQSKSIGRNYKYNMRKKQVSNNILFLWMKCCKYFISAKTLFFKITFTDIKWELWQKYCGDSHPVRGSSSSVYPYLPYCTLSMLETWALRVENRRYCTESIQSFIISLRSKCWMGRTGRIESESNEDGGLGKNEVFLPSWLFPSLPIPSSCFSSLFFVMLIKARTTIV